MRIAVATRTLSRIGGVEVYVERSVQGLSAAGHDVRVFPEQLDTGPRARLDVPAWSPRFSGETLPAAVRAWAPDVVVTHGLHDPSTEDGLAALHPSVFFAHAYHGTCISGAKAHSFPGDVRPCQRVLGAGCLLRYYPRRCGGLSPVTMLRDYARERRRLAAVRRHDRVFALSSHVAGEYERHGVPRARIRVLPPPVPLARACAGGAHEADHVVYLGRLERLKGPVLAIAAVAEAATGLGRRLALTIAGDGSGAAEVQRAAARMPASLVDVRLAGRLDPPASADLLSRAGLLIVPSRWPEPFGLVGLEAAAAGVPVVAFGVGGIPEWLVDGVTGHLAAAHGDPVHALAAAIVRALEDPRRYAGLREGARRAYRAAAERDHVGALVAELGDLLSKPRAL